jgi:hypothetical protein
VASQRQCLTHIAWRRVYWYCRVPFPARIGKFDCVKGVWSIEPRDKRAMNPHPGGTASVPFPPRIGACCAVPSCKLPQPLLLLLLPLLLLLLLPLLPLPPLPLPLLLVLNAAVRARSLRQVQPSPS